MQFVHDFCSALYGNAVEHVSRRKWFNIRVGNIIHGNGG